MLPSRRDRVIDIKLPTLQTTDDAVNTMSIIIEAMGSGQITISEGESISRVIDAFLKVIQTHELEKRSVC